MKFESWFTRFAKAAARGAGHPAAFAIAAFAIIVWALTGPIFSFGNTWQLIINTSTTIVTFLMVFVIQNTQNRDNLAINIKLDTIMSKLGVTSQDLIEAE